MEINFIIGHACTYLLKNKNSIFFLLYIFFIFVRKKLNTLFWVFFWFVFSVVMLFNYYYFIFVIFVFFYVLVFSSFFFVITRFLHRFFLGLITSFCNPFLSSAEKRLKWDFLIKICLVYVVCHRRRCRRYRLNVNWQFWLL